MKKLASIVVALGLVAAAPAHGQGVEITPIAARPSTVVAGSPGSGTR